MPDLTRAIFDIRTLERNAQKNTALHRVHPLAKLIVTACYIVCVVSYPRYNIGGLLVFAVYPLLLLILSETPPGQLLKRLLVVLPIAAAACAANLFLDHNIAFTIGPVAVSYGFLSFVSVLIKALLTVAAALLFIACTPLSDIAAALRQLRLPEVIVAQLLLVYRYLDLLMKEASSVYTAYKLRAPTQKGIKWRDMGSFLGGLLLRSIGRGEHVYTAMQLRGFAGNLRIRSIPRPGAADFAFIGVLCALFILARAMNVENIVGGMLV